MVASIPDDAPQPRLCQLKPWHDYKGYGFKLHAEKGTVGQYIDHVVAGSPAHASGLLEGDRIVEINGANISGDNHQQVVQRIKASPNESHFLVVDRGTDEYYRGRNSSISGKMLNVLEMNMPDTQQEWIENTDMAPKSNPYEVSSMASSDYASKTNSRVSIIDAEDNEEDLRWGCGKCKPSWMQWCNNPKAFLACLCWFSFIQGFTLNGVNNVNISTLERRFQLSSSQASLISSSYDISAGLLVLPLTYFATYRNQPRILACAILIFSCGSFIMMIPQWTTGLYELGSSVADTCDTLGNSTTCEHTSLSKYLGVFIFGQLLHGVGGTTLYTLGVIIIDNSVSSRKFSFYQGIFFFFSAFGPAVGYILGGKFLDIYVDFTRVSSDSLNVNTDDPRWVGAWWIGYTAGGIFSLTAFLLFLPYSRELPSAAKVRRERVSEAHQDGSEEIASKENFGKSIKDLPKSMKMLLTNPVLMCINLAAVFEGAITTGYATFLAKVIQNQFGQIASTAALVAGAVSVPGAAGGQLLGGIIMSAFKLKVRGGLRLCIVFAGISILLSFQFLGHCDTEIIMGVNEHYADSLQITEDYNLTSACNADCHCTSASYEPICGNDGIQYFSPCHAGCMMSFAGEPDKVFSNCTCIPESAGNWATGKKCSVPCPGYPGLLVPFFGLIFTTMILGIPGLYITLRCVPDSQKTFALGIQNVLLRCFGYVSGPIVLGAIFDKACIQWQYKCSERGSCWIYDNYRLGIYLTAATLGFKIMAAIFWTLAYVFYKPPPEEGLVKSPEGDKNKIKNGDRNIEMRLGVVNVGADLSSEENLSSDNDSKYKWTDPADIRVVNGGDKVGVDNKWVDLDLGEKNTQL